MKKEQLILEKLIFMKVINLIKKLFKNIYLQSKLIKIIIIFIKKIKL